MIEYGLLRPILIEESSEHLDRPLTRRGGAVA